MQMLFTEDERRISMNDEEVLNGNLNVTIHKLQGLDYACDTYCCLEMDSYGHFYKKAQTRICFNMHDPSWDEDFELDLDGSQTLRILCYKRRPGEEVDIVIGKCALELSLTWLNSEFNMKTITMHNISITISIRYTPASKTMKRTQSKMMSGIFGVRIEYVTRRENRTVPTIVTVCCQEVEKRALNEVGIYQVSGVTSEVQQLKKMFDKNLPAAMHQVEDADIHAVTGVLKLYFRELPEPLFTDKQYKSFTQAVELKDEDSKEKCMLDLLHSLPDANYYTIAFMIEHLVRVAKKSSENKMSTNKLAAIFGTTLLHPAETDHTKVVVQCEVVQYFIKLAASGRNIRKSAQT